MKIIRLVSALFVVALLCSCEKSNSPPSSVKNYGSREVQAISFIREKDIDSLEIFPIYGDPNKCYTERFLVWQKDGSVLFYEVTFNSFGLVDDSFNKSMIFPPIGQ